MRRIELKGKRFGRLVVESFAYQAKNGNAFWRCKCDCGNTIVTDSYRLRKGITVSCGCYRKEVMHKAIYANAKTRVHIGNAKSLLVDDNVNLVALTKKSVKNHSGVIGVSFDKRSGKWNARMVFKGKLVLNQRFGSFADAVSARKAAERKYVAPVISKYDGQPESSFKSNQA